MQDDAGDFATFAQARWVSLVRSAVFLGCSPADAQDAAQTTLLKCCLAWTKVTGAANPDAYVYRILLNCLHDSRRRPWSRERPTAVVPERMIDDQSGQIEVADAVHRALSKLSKVNREAVVLRHLTGLSEHQTSEVLGIALGTVKSRTARGLAELAKDASLSDLSGGSTS